MNKKYIRGSAGGKVMAPRLRKKALDLYYSNPKICLYCCKIIQVPNNKKVTKIRVKKFCNSSCAASYNNIHKSYGIRRSKMEKYLEKGLKILFPNLQIEFNSKKIIGSELDIYVPSFNLAIEINGIFHYEPIFGKDKLVRVKNNDATKIKRCNEMKIDIIIIPTLEAFSKKIGQQYLDKIVEIFKSR